MEYPLMEKSCVSDSASHYRQKIEFKPSLPAAGPQEDMLFQLDAIAAAR